MKNRVSDRTIGRLSLYRRLLSRMLDDGRKSIFSHELAVVGGGSAAQVRRDLMDTGCTGSPTKGYDVSQLIEGIGGYLDDPRGQRIALVGVGNLGRALLAFFSSRRPKLSIVAAFDVDPYKTGRTISGCPCHPLSDLAETVKAQGITVGIITVPRASAQGVADSLVAAGVKGILNLVPVPLRVGPGVFVEDIAITTALEKVAFFARVGCE